MAVIPYSDISYKTLSPHSIYFLCIIEDQAFSPSYYLAPFPPLTDEKKRSFPMEIQMGSVAKSYMRKHFLIYEEMRKYLTIYEEAVSHI
jgi:hypothetical protein